MADDSVGKLWASPQALRYVIKNHPTRADCSPQEVDRCLATACKKWEAVAGNFSFHQSGDIDSADIHFQFGAVANKSMAAQTAARGAKPPTVITFSNDIRWTSQEHSLDTLTQTLFLGPLMLFIRKVAELKLDVGPGDRGVDTCSGGTPTCGTGRVPTATCAASYAGTVPARGSLPYAASAWRGGQPVLGVV